MTTTKTLTLLAGLTAALSIAPAHAQDGWTSLFDGKTLDGWEQKNGTAKYEVVDGTIVGTTAEGSPNSFLATKEEYGDFELEFDVKVDDQLNSGVQIRSKTKGDTPDGRVYGPQVEIEASGSGGAEAGYIYGEATDRGWLVPDDRRAPHSHFKDGEWNRYRVVAKGPRIQTFINGNEIIDLTDEEIYETHPSGFIALQVHSVGAGSGPYQVAWKNIRIKPLDGQGASASAGGDFKKIFDGESAEGWFTTPENPQVWRVIQRDDSAPELARDPDGSYLWYDEAVGDFVLELEFMVSPGCNSGIFFRTDPQNPVQGGFEIQVFDSAGKEPSTHNAGALYDAKPADVMAVKPAGEWNTFRLKADGPHIVVHMNGQQVQDVNLDDWDTANQNPDGSKNKFNTALKDLPRTGHIGFQDHGHDVWFRNIQLKKL